jgi:hypothetical protein
MLRNAGWPLAGVLAGLLAGLLAPLGCTPGPIAPRAPDAKTTGAGNTGGSDVHVAAQDAAARPADAAGVASPGRGGAGGDAALDAGRVVDAMPGEVPKLPRPDAGRDGAPPDRPPEAPVAVAPQPGEIAIAELLVNPAGDDLGREWIEIMSRAGAPRDLSQLHLATATTDVAAPGGTIAPGALLVLGQSGDPTKNGGAPVEVAYGTKLILVNADGQLSLCLGACATGVALGTLSWGSLGDAFTGHALIVDPATGSFCAAQAPFGTGGSFGTPGAPNPPCVENVDGGSQTDVSVAD